MHPRLSVWRSAPADVLETARSRSGRALINYVSKHCERHAEVVAVQVLYT